MARFIFEESGDAHRFRLEAEQGEVISTEMVAAYALLCQADALDRLAANIVSLDNAVNRAADNLTDVAAR
jgi:hypothetical protein